jgi:hypothetical protein
MTQAAINASEPSGIGGWLILPAIGIVVAPIWFAMNVFDYFPGFELLEPGTLVHAMTMVEILGLIGFAILGTLTAVQFFTYKRSAPRLYRTFMVGQLLFLVGEYWAAAILLGRPMFDASSGFAIGKWLVACLIWIPYFLYSARVRNTFVR